MAVGVTQVPLGYQAITPSSVTSLTVPSGANQASIVAEAGPIRIRDDGVAPTATVGWLLPVGVALLYVGTLTNLQAIQSSGSAGTLHVLYYK